MSTRNSFVLAAVVAIVTLSVGSGCQSERARSDTAHRESTSSTNSRDECFRVDFYRAVRLLEIDSENRLIVDQGALGDPELTLTVESIATWDGSAITVADPNAIATLADLALREPPFSVFAKFSFEDWTGWAMYFPPPVATATMQPELHFDDVSLPLRVVARRPVAGIDFEAKVRSAWEKAKSSGDCP